MSPEELEKWMARLSWAPTLEEWDKIALAFEAALRDTKSDETA